MQSRHSRGFWIRLLARWVGPWAVLMVPSWASAQTISFAKSYPDRTVTLRAGGLQPYWISRSDCLQDDEYIFEVTMQQVASSADSLEVWATTTGANCADFGTRNTVTASPNCYPVYYAAAQVGTPQVRIRDQDIVDARAVDAKTQAVGHGTVANCTPAAGTTGSIPVTLYFVVVDTSGAGVASVKYDLKYDLVGPPPPTGVNAGVAENSLVVSWTTSQSTDVYGFNLYCLPATPAPTGAAGQNGAGGSASTVPAEGGTAGTEAVREAGESGVAGASTGGSAADESAGTTGTTGATTNPSCLASTNGNGLTLTPGELPDPSLWCGKVEGGLQSAATATGLGNGDEYAVGVAAFDLVGNVGPLSTLSCQTPQLVADFYDRYREAGGEAGGGFCATGPARSPWGVAALAGGWLVYAIRRRRRT